MKKHLMPLLRDLAVTGFGTFLIFLFGGLPAVLIASLLGGNADVIVYIALAVSYPLAFYFLYARRHGKRAAKRFTADYRFLADMKEYLLTEGKYLLAIYLLAAVVAVLCRNNETAKAVTLALGAVFPLGFVDLRAAWPMLVCMIPSALLAFALVGLARRLAWHAWYEEDYRLSDRDLQNANMRRRILYNPLKRGRPHHKD